MHALPKASLALTLASLVLSLGCDPFKLDTTRSRTTPALRAFDSCTELESELKSHLKEELRVTLEQANYGWGFRGGPVAADAAEAGGATNGAGSRQEGVDYSGTNNQENGVDEADFVKTDGYFIYVLNGGRLEILGVPEFGELTAVSSVAVEGVPSQMLLSGDKVAVFSHVWAQMLPADDPLRLELGDDTPSGWWWRGQNLTKVTVIDLGADRTSPAVEREIYIEGYLLTGREVDGSIRMVSHGMLEIPGVQYWPTLPDSYWQLSDLDPRRQIAFDNAVEEAIAHNNAAIDAASLDDFIPAMFERKREGGVDVVARTTFGEGACGNFSMAEDGQSRGITSILTLRPFDGGVSVESDHVVTNWPTVYASADVLLLAEMAEEWWWFWNNDSFDEATNIHRFDISTPGKTVYRGSGRIDGLVPGQFGLSEHQGDVRVAATTGQWNRWWLENPAPTENHVYVLRGAESLDVIGHVGGIASGERIWASRFDDDRAYLVTFQSIDPLFTVDLSSPAHPKVIGELEIPGVSTYIHPLDGDRLLTIGIGGTEDGLSWGETQLSLFDVSDFAHPARDAVLGLTPGEVSANDGWAWSWSEALYEHKAFQYWGPQSMLAVPTSTYRSFNDGNHWGYEYRSLLQLVKVEGDTLSLHGAVDHSALYNADPETWWYWRDIRRSIFMGDFIYVVSDLGVTVHDLETLEETASVLLAGSNDLCQSYWYCY